MRRREFLSAAAIAALAGCQSASTAPEPAIYSDYEGPGYVSRDLIDVDDPEGWVDDISVRAKFPVEWGEDVGEWEENGGPSPTPPSPDRYMVTLDLDLSDAEYVPTTLVFRQGPNTITEGIPDWKSDYFVNGTGEWRVAIVSRGSRVLPGFRLAGHGVTWGTEKFIGSFGFSIGRAWR